MQRSKSKTSPSRKAMSSTGAAYVAIVLSSVSGREGAGRRQVRGGRPRRRARREGSSRSGHAVPAGSVRTKRCPQSTISRRASGSRSAIMRPLTGGTIGSSAPIRISAGTRTRGSQGQLVQPTPREQLVEIAAPGGARIARRARRGGRGRSGVAAVDVRDRLDHVGRVDVAPRGRELHQHARAARHHDEAGAGRCQRERAAAAGKWWTNCWARRRPRRRRRRRPPRSRAGRAGRAESRASQAER